MNEAEKDAGKLGKFGRYLPLIGEAGFGCGRRSRRHGRPCLRRPQQSDARRRPAPTPGKTSRTYCLVSTAILTSRASRRSPALAKTIVKPAPARGAAQQTPMATRFIAMTRCRPASPPATSSRRSRTARKAVSSPVSARCCNSRSLTDRPAHRRSAVQPICVTAAVPVEVSVRRREVAAACP